MKQDAHNGSHVAKENDKVDTPALFSSLLFADMLNEGRWNLITIQIMSFQIIYNRVNGQWNNTWRKPKLIVFLNIDEN